MGFLDIMLCPLNRLQDSVHITCIRTGKTNISCNLLYCGICFIAVIWNWTQNICEVSLYKETEAERDEEATGSKSHIWQIKASEISTQAVDPRAEIYNQTQSTGPFWTQSTAITWCSGILMTPPRPVLGPGDERGRRHSARRMLAKGLSADWGPAQSKDATHIWSTLGSKLLESTVCCSGYHHHRPRLSLEPGLELDPC